AAPARAGLRGRGAGRDRGPRSVRGRAAAGAGGLHPLRPAPRRGRAGAGGPSAGGRGMNGTTLRLALLGNPNCGKTALFNQLTGSRQKVANYAGVTVERKEGRLVSPSGRTYTVLDLPGAYSLNPASLDEAITRDLCRGFYPGEPAPDVLVCVVDATNLRLHLRFALEVRELGRPMVVALNMADVARRRGIRIDRAALEEALGVPVVETVAVHHNG